MPRGTHPNSLANLQKGKRFGSGKDGATSDARKAHEKATQARKANFTVKELMLNLLEEPLQNGGTLREALVRRTVKMAADGNLPAFQYVMRIIGEDPGDIVNIKTPRLSEDAKADIDKLLKETRGEVK